MMAVQVPAVSAEDLVRGTIYQQPDSRGLAIVVACQQSRVFPKDTLFGVINDFSQTCSAFQHLHYAVVPLPNAPRQYIVDTIEAVVKWFPKYSDEDLRYKRIVFSFAGHGNAGGIHTGDGEIKVQEEIMLPLLPKNCPRLRHIPKLFFIDACRGGEVDQPVPRGGGPSNQAVYSRVSGMANYLLVQSTLPTKKAFETGGHYGGYWTQAFVAELRKRSNCGKDIGYILIEVNRVVNSMFNSIPDCDMIQQAISESTLLEHVFLLDETHWFGGIHPDHFTAGGPPVGGGELSALGGRGGTAAPSTGIPWTPSIGTPRTPSTSAPPQTPSTGTPQTPSTSTSWTTSNDSADGSYVQRGPNTPVSQATPTPTPSPVDELKQRVRESHGESATINYEVKEERGGYRATVLVPGMGYVRGDVRTSTSGAKRLAATEALKLLKE